MTSAKTQAYVCGEFFKDLDVLYMQELEPVREDTDNIDFRLQCVLGLVHDRDSFQEWKYERSW